jgi:hypothetical protein
LPRLSDAERDRVVAAVRNAERDRVVAAVRNDKHVEAIRLLREFAGVDLRDGKALEMHVTRNQGICVRCRGPLQEPGQTECPKCGSLNLDW